MGPDDKEKSEDKQQDKRYNPGEKFAQEEFGTQGKPPARNEKASENLRDGEANTAGPNKNENVGQAERQGGGKPGGAGGLGGAAAGAASLAGGAAGLAGKALKFIMGHKKSSAGTAGIMIILILIAFNLALPVAVKEEEVEAVLKDGVLTVSFNKVKQEQARRIEIQ
ncbi:hypothetical protein TM7_0067 [candidate division TM7 genomosp. GTL1]|nr:hypothetical protein TM7_0067 [candidate division TM7 genomosp. GTL1]